jgi:hypothetical protein
MPRPENKARKIFSPKGQERNRREEITSPTNGHLAAFLKTKQQVLSQKKKVISPPFPFAK